MNYKIEICNGLGEVFLLSRVLRMCHLVDIKELIVSLEFTSKCGSHGSELYDSTFTR